VITEDLVDQLALTPTRLSSREGRQAGALLRAARWRQWTKNVLVFAVPGAAGMLGNGTAMRDAALAFVAFCLASSSTYLLNDVMDVEADRRHARKRHRPIAAGELSVRLAVVSATVGFGLAAVVAVLASPALLGVIAAYVALSLAYSRHLKHVPVFDIAVVASGFFLRAVAGGLASHIFVSRWFLIIAGAGSLFLVTGKRYAELNAIGELAERTRPVLAQYTTDYLRALLSTTAAVTVVAYCLWAFQGVSAQHHPSGWTGVSAVPFVLGIMRYGLLLEHGHGEEPEQVVLGDRTLILIGLTWVGVFLAGTLG
jgi:decaprenyl-phosphate phosphoribosyltransferase